MSRIAIIGAGAAGLTAAYLLQRQHQITLFEKERQMGGHAHTIEVIHGPDAGTPLDVGFMVLNDRNYPTLHKLLAQLGGIELGTSEMSFGYTSAHDGLQYAINWHKDNPWTKKIHSTTLATAKRPNKMLLAVLKDIVRFSRLALHDLQTAPLANSTLREYLYQHAFSPCFIQHYLLPMGAAIWSTPTQHLGDFPAESFLRFFAQHGLLALTDGPQWQYIKGGSRTYVEAMLKRFTGVVRAQTPVVSVTRQAQGICIKTQGDDAQPFDAVILATHADEALRLLSDPSADEQRVLGAWRYHVNRAVLHTDRAVMPPDPTAWASWNYAHQGERYDSAGPCITYHLNRLQSHQATAKQYFLTLNRPMPITPEHTLREITFTHPLYTFASRRTQGALAALNGTRSTYFCGSYCGYGFHEDAVKSAVTVAQAFGCDL